MQRFGPAWKRVCGVWLGLALLPVGLLGAGAWTDCGDCSVVHVWGFCMHTNTHVQSWSTVVVAVVWGSPFQTRLFGFCSSEFVACRTVSPHVLGDCVCSCSAATLTAGALCSVVTPMMLHSSSKGPVICTEPSANVKSNRAVTCRGQPSDPCSEFSTQFSTWSLRARAPVSHWLSRWQV